MMCVANKVCQPNADFCNRNVHEHTYLSFIFILFTFKEEIDSGSCTVHNTKIIAYKLHFSMEDKSRIFAFSPSIPPWSLEKCAFLFAPYPSNSCTFLGLHLGPERILTARVTTTSLLKLKLRRVLLDSMHASLRSPPLRTWRMRACRGAISTVATPSRSTGSWTFTPYSKIAHHVDLPDLATKFAYLHIFSRGIHSNSHEAFTSSSRARRVVRHQCFPPTACFSTNLEV